MNAILIISGLGVASLVAEFTNLRRWLSAVIVLGLLAAIILTVGDRNASLRFYNDMVVFDNFAIAFSVQITLVGILWFWSASEYFLQREARTDRAALALFAMVGSIVMTSFNNMAMLFLGIEILSISLYAMAGLRRDLNSTEAAFKYLLMGSFATGFLLFGIALVYGATGLFHIDALAQHIAANASTLPSFFYIGVVLMLVGLAFKISAVPFHFWAPDVYTGSPTTVTAFMATIVKIAAIASFLRVFTVCFGGVQTSWSIILEIITLLTLLLPNLMAAYQDNVKRMLAYSSVGHVGFILLAMISAPSLSSGTILYYLAAYSAASVGTFSILIILERNSPDLTLQRFKGLFGKNPLLAIGMTTALLSLAGIPPLAGFFGKYIVLVQAIGNDTINIGMVAAAIVASLIGVYYYFRVIIVMFLKEGDGTPATATVLQNVLIVLLIALTVVLGLFPDGILKLF
jgi:NADH-quinone oxidoreductase subunit N